MRSPLTETIYKVQGMITYVRENLSTDEFMLFLDLLVPQPEPETAKATKKKTTQQRKLEHCTVCDYTKRAAVHKDTTLSDYHEFQSAKPKSKRAASLAEQIKTTGRPRSSDGLLCTACDFDSDHNIHHLASTDGYHPFQSGARSAALQSSASDGERSTEVNSVDETVSAGGAIAAVGRGNNDGTNNIS